MLIPLQGAVPPSCGGKAGALRRLLEHGLPVPAGVCLPVSVYRSALPAVLPPADGARDLSRVDAQCRQLIEHLRRWEPTPAVQDALSRAAGELGWPLVARSSATCEDLEGSLMPGIFSSVLGIGSLEALTEAIRRCWVSLWSVPAWALLQHRHSWPGEEGMALILQRQALAEYSGVALSHDPADASVIRVEAVKGSGHRLACGLVDPLWFHLPRDDTAADAQAGLPVTAVTTLRRYVLEAEVAMGGPVEVEWVIEGPRLWLVQARPASLSPERPEFPLRWRRAQHRQERWRWDREHNPDPLSPAHASLMDTLEQADGPPRFMVQNGYLYHAVRRDDPDDPTERVGELSGDLGARWLRFEQHSVQQMQQLESSADEALSLEPAIEFIREFYAVYFGTLSGARRAARARLSEFLRAELGGLDPEQEALLTVPVSHLTLERAHQMFRISREPGASAELSRAVRDHLDQFGTLFPCWDVATRTLAEQPHLLLSRVRSLSEVSEDPATQHRQQVARARLLEQKLAARLDPARRDRFGVLVEEARLARSLEENDDVLFSRALALVRRTLLQMGRELWRQGRLDTPEDIFLLPLDRAQVSQDPGGAKLDLRAECARQRQEWESNRQRIPPLIIDGERVIYDTPANDSRCVLNGQGIGGVARGRVRLVSRLQEMLQGDFAGAVVVCPTLLPALAVILPEVTALVTDHGGLLSHAACLARELGKVAVVGTRAATAVLEEDEWVWVDGQRGVVVPIGRGDGHAPGWDR